MTLGRLVGFCGALVALLAGVTGGCGSRTELRHGGGDGTSPVGAGASAGTGPGATCGRAEVACSGVCVNVNVDPAHCGACGTVCETPEVCSRGECKRGCDEALTNCAGACVDLDDD